MQVTTQEQRNKKVNGLNSACANRMGESRIRRALVGVNGLSLITFIQ